MAPARRCGGIRSRVRVSVAGRLECATVDLFVGPLVARRDDADEMVFHEGLDLARPGAWLGLR